MNRQYQRTNRRDPAKRISNEVWKQHQPVLRNLYKKKGLPLPEVMKKMESQYNFKATTKQYRYRLGQVWGWIKYNHNNGNYPSPKSQTDSYSDIIGTPTFTSRMECDDLLTPSGSDDDVDEGRTIERGASTLCSEFLSVFSDDGCYPVHTKDFPFLPGIIAQIKEQEQRYKVSMKGVVVHDLTQIMLPTKNSADVTAYHRLNFVLRHIPGNLGGNQCQSFSDTNDTLPITELSVLEEQMWYRNFDENSPLSRCLQSCFKFCQECILSNQLGGGDAVPPPFNSLGNGEDDEEASTFRKDVCLFVYLWDAWASTHEDTSAGTRSQWDGLAKSTLGITPTMVLRTMSSLILTVAADQPEQPASSVTRQRRWSVQLHNNGGNGELFELAREGVKTIGNGGTWEGRYLVSEFIREFVWIHDTHDTHAGDDAATRVEKAVRIAAQEYITQWQLRMEQPVDDQESGDDDDIGDCMEVDINKGDGDNDRGDGGVETWIFGDPVHVDYDSSIMSEEE